MIINRLEFIQRVHIDQTTLDVWLGEQWLLPNRSLPDLEFSEIDLARASFILDLQRDLGVNDEGVGIILDLVDQMHGLRKVLSAVLHSRGENGAY
ncbi:chaperone modulator CbpM [Rhizobium sp. PL01]|uniref:chaperone modulator CbpM n=1 Tax=Rhizobium sp. PL01 TaxID=3085631 RepID=UPI0029823067|nr:chaperone modulator CbpM [Rhizobium sp. PL01]MDW5317503.1 chaperone modulator CbpM [Rhizobium sp. PL01]